MAGRTLRRFIEGLGYVIHTPASVFGRERLEEGLYDEDWLPVAGANSWTVFCRDQHILDREAELRAYLDARVHMFVLPGNANRDQILELLSVNLQEICTLAVARKPSVYWLTGRGVVPYEQRQARAKRQRGTR